MYGARDARLGRDVAIKVLPAGVAGDPERLQRFEQEARAAAALSHPNILAVHDIGQHDGVPYMVAELLQGETSSPSPSVTSRRRLHASSSAVSTRRSWRVSIRCTPESVLARLVVPHRPVTQRSNIALQGRGRRGRCQLRSLCQENRRIGRHSTGRGLSARALARRQMGARYGSHVAGPPDALSDRSR